MSGRFSDLSHGGGRFFILLLVLVGLIYGNSLHAIWTLDDGPNILQNPRLHITDLLPETLFQTFFSTLHPDANGQPGFNRPLAHLSFALNWYVGQDSTVGYRLVNIFIHALTAFVLFLVIHALIQAPNLNGKYCGQEDFIALLGSVLWAVNPIQTQAVVYIVQRMASLSCLFYLLAIWCYMQARSSGKARRRTVFYLLTLASFICGAGSKENALLLPASLLLLEFTFFQDLTQPWVRRRLSYILAAGIGLLIVGGSWLFATGRLMPYLDYSSRLFSPWERLLTEPRILIFYLSQIFYPAPTRLSIDHDVEISRSLLEPWTTLPAILAVLVLIVLAFMQMRKRPFLSFAVLFFFLNHLIESSVLGLELIFEHRNYLPSLFLFVPVACGLQWLIGYYRVKGLRFQYVILAFVILMISGLGVSTHTRNMAWLDAKTFWEDAVRKAPLSIRPVHNLAYHYYEKNGFYQEALELYRKELELKSYNRRDISIAYVNIANHHYRTGDYATAIHHLESALRNCPEFELVQYRLASVLAYADRLEQAIGTLRPLLAKRPGAFDYQFLAAQICLKNKMFPEGLEHLRHCLRLSAASIKAMFMTGVALNLSGYAARAEWFFHMALDRKPDDQRLLLWMIDCKLKQSDDAGAREYAGKLIKCLSPRKFQAGVARELGDGFMPEKSIEDMVLWMQELLEVLRSKEENEMG